MSTRLQIGDLYKESLQGTLGTRFLGSIIFMTRQILDGGYPGPTPEQTAWATFISGADRATHEHEAKLALEWGLVNNSTLIDQGSSIEDTDLDYIVGEYAKTFDTEALLLHNKQ